jgi:N-acetylglucosamine PTS system EIICBA or EIICB component
LIRSAVKITGKVGSYMKIQDFCDMNKFEQIMKNWAGSTGLATVAVGADGKYISDCYNFTEFCIDLTRGSAEGKKRCEQCDREGHGVYPCHAGLVDFGIPITLEDGTVLGSIIGGQVLPENPDEEKFRQTARELGIDEDKYIKALKKVNVKTKEQIDASANLLGDVKEEKCMKFLQKLGKALMLPVAVLPICGILMGIGYWLCPATMQGGAIEGVRNLIGLFLVKAGGALIDNMAILFAIGVGVGMSEKNDGTGAIAALASWLMLTTLLSTGFVTTIMPSIAEDATKTLAFDKIANPFIGIIAGIIGSMCYNKFKDTKLPDWLSFFSGKRCVAIVAGVVSILASVVLLFVWPLLFGGLVALGEAIVSLDVVGAGIYAFLNRLLIPTGLHHALNNVFWFDTIGLGDLQHFWKGETSADVSWSLGMYMSGFFPCMMFGVPGAALAMVKCAKPAKKKAAIGLVASAAICSFICGVTEPFEFAFMFLAPGLYVIYAALYGIFTMITVALGFRAGFSFSAGAMDLLFSSRLPAAARIWLIIPLGIAAFVVFYFVFLFAIKKWDLKTPGREDDDVEAEKKIELANDDFAAIAATILEGCGGKDNIASIDNCITRLRLEVKDITAVNDKVIKSAGVAGVMKPGKTSVQVIIGPKVQFVADAFSKLCE